MPYRRGDVVSVPYEYSDLSGGKACPAVVVSSDVYNLAQLDVVAAGISTQVATALAALPLSNTSVAEYLSAHVDLVALPGRLVQSLAEKSLRAGFVLAARSDPAIDLVSLRTLLAGS